MIFKLFSAKTSNHKIPHLPLPSPNREKFTFWPIVHVYCNHLTMTIPKMSSCDSARAPTSIGKTLRRDVWDGCTRDDSCSLVENIQQIKNINRDFIFSIFSRLYDRPLQVPTRNIFQNLANIWRNRERKIGFGQRNYVLQIKPK